ncbi:hypothetical protein DEU56DRAFT_919656 [Suillus clintonianus]|uniref:uncharacterized protein n=1 Tax=Suillus clintonianus TaxID=1904413 RepID=UPI001B868E5D|nr:uncharacterized protein DEU56DRAFT_919656 [Suillus clintonianus]KAG2113978.1 hypothetical protein DEU56DRAFT_919656 [Suillus clintonianus]
MAIVLIEAEQNLDMAKLIEKIDALIQGPIAQLEEKAEEIAEATEMHKNALESAVSELRGNLHISSESIEKIVTNATRASQIENQIEPRAERPNGSQSYASVVRNEAPPQLTKILARSEAQAKQILIDKRTYGEVDSLRGLTEAELVAKAKLTIELVERDGTAIPPNIDFCSARRLPHGGILLELNTVKSAQWFDTPANRGAFIANFSHNVTIKDRSYNVLIENIPVTYNPGSVQANTEIEKREGLKPGTITRSRWIKPWESHKRRSEDSRYRYFPTSDPLTWETLSNETEQRREPPENATWNQQATDLNTHGNYGRLQLALPTRGKDSQQQNNDRRQTKGQHSQINPNRIPIGTQAQLMDNWLNTRNNDDPSKRTVHYELSPSPHPTTPLWYPSPTPEPNTERSTPTGFD